MPSQSCSFNASCPWMPAHPRSPQRQQCPGRLGANGGAGCALAPILFGLREYRGEPHRVEPIGMLGEVEFFDDSKGTNVAPRWQRCKGLGAERKVVVILGGEGKGQDFCALAEPVARYARAVVLIGA